MGRRRDAAKWHEQTPTWCKLYGGAYYGASHADLPFEAFAVWPWMLWHANRYGRRPDGSGVVRAGETTLNAQAIARRMNARTTRIQRAIDALVAVGSLHVEGSGKAQAYVIPNLREWQETRQARWAREERPSKVDAEGRGVEAEGRGIEAEESQIPREQVPLFGTEEVDGTMPPRPSGRPGRARVPSGEVDEVIACYADVRDPDGRLYHPRWKATKKDRDRVRARLKEGFTVADLKRAIVGCHRTPFNLGQNERQQKYLSFELITRDATKVSQFVERFDEAERRAAGGGSQRQNASAERLARFAAGGHDAG